MLFRKRKLKEFQRNLNGEIIEAGEMVRVRRSKEDPNLVDITSVSPPKRIVKNVPASCVE